MNLPVGTTPDLIYSLYVPILVSRLHSRFELIMICLQPFHVCFGCWPANSQPFLLIRLWYLIFVSCARGGDCYWGVFCAYHVEMNLR